MSLIDWSKNIFSVLREAGKIKEYEKISKLTEENSDLKNKLVEASRKVITLEKKINQKKNLVYRNNCYWDEEGGSYCSRCFDEFDMPIRIHPTYVGSNFFICPKCKTEVNITGRPDFVQTHASDQRNSAR